MSELNAALEEAIVLHQQGELAQAKTICEHLLTAQPNNADAAHLLGIIEYQLHNLERAVQLFTQAVAINPSDVISFVNRGLALAQLNQYKEAVESYNHAININPDFFDAHFNRGNALSAFKQWESAIQSYDYAINLKPDCAAAYFVRGNALHALGELEAAIGNYNQATTIDPNYADAHNNRGNILQELKRFDDALESYNLAININSDFAEGYFNRGIILQALQRFEEAVHSFDHAIHIKPDFAEAYLNRGNALQTLKQFEAALESYDQAIALNPNFADAYYSRGNVFKKTQRLEEAVESYSGAITRRPDFAKAYSNRGIVLVELKQWEAALNDYDRAIAIKPDYAEFYHNKALLLLSLKHFEEGWQLYEWRSKIERANYHPIKITRQWNGKKLEGSILILPEQGLGDEIFYSNMLNDLQPFVDDITACVDSRLIPLYQRSFKHIKYISRDSVPPLNEYDAQIYTGNLGRFFRVNPQDFKNIKSPFIQACKQKTKIFRERLKDKKLLCGLSWISTNTYFGFGKTLRLRDLSSILSLPDVEFIDLQYGDTSKEQTDFFNETGIQLMRVEEVDNFNDIDSLASLIDACDVVLTISNTTAHLAAALGKKVIVMLPYARGLFWYWHEGDEKNPWYPTVTLARQSQNGDWVSVVERVKILLKEEL